jgi:hypothetical protein
MECLHNMKQVTLDNVGDYAVFQSNCFHKGYYFVHAGTAVYTAQLFAKHTSDILQARLTRQNTPLNSIIEGHVDNTAIMEKLSTDLVRNWDTKYSWENFPKCKFFGNEWIDVNKNRHIHSNKFREVKTIDNLVTHFQLKFPHLSIDSVWLIKKESVDDGFQGWHRDFKLVNTIMTTIVVNVGAVTFSS